MKDIETIFPPDVDFQLRVDDFITAARQGDAIRIFYVEVTTPLGNEDELYYCTNVTMENNIIYLEIPFWCGKGEAREWPHLRIYNERILINRQVDITEIIIDFQNFLGLANPFKITSDSKATIKES